MRDPNDSLDHAGGRRAVLVLVIAGIVSVYTAIMAATLLISAVVVLWVGFYEARSEFGWVVVRVLAVIPCLVVLLGITLLTARPPRRRR